MKTISKMRNIIFILLVIMTTIFISNENVFAAEVDNFEQLKNEIKTGTDKEIKIKQAIEVTETLIIGRDVTISGGELKAESSLISSDTDFEIQRRSGNIFYLEKGKSLTLENITLDGNEKARIIFTEGGSIILKNATLQNGTTENFGKLEKAGDDKQNYSGGAILATQASKLDVTGGSFINNNTGSKYLDAKRAAEGGAIKIDSSELTVNGTTFTGNHLDSSADEGGRQGGAIEATNTTATINNATFDIVGPFNTGGAIKFEDCPQATVTGSTFTIAENEGQFGVAGGAITSQGSNLTIDNSTFNTGKGSYVQESGGLIQVADSGEFHLKNSTLNGSGVGWNETGANKTAKYGGAIVFYDDSSVTATIENTTIQNFTAEISGGGIALNTQVGKNGGTNLTLIDTKILNNLAYAYNMTAYGGGIFVGEGNTVTMKGGQISSKESSSVGGGIYNEGKVTLTKSEKGNAQIVNNKAYHMAAGVLNDGELIVDYANFSGNAKGDWSNANQHVYKKDEMAGENIYAVKDVTITPNAKFDGKDVRILDDQSKIILTGKLTKQINVSISEASKKQPDKTINDPRYPLHPKFNESQNRKVGYIVAAGDGSYTPTAEDAKQIHYVSKDTSQARAEFGDQESTGKWDFVLNPNTKQVVLGQRVKLTLHANGYPQTPAKFEGVTAGRDDENGILTKLTSEESEDKKEDIYDIYEPGPKSAILAPKPVRKNYAFTGWYKEFSVRDNAPDENKPKKTKVNDQKLVEGAGEITSIIEPNEYELYAGWEKAIKVKKVWDDEDNKYGNRPDKVTVTLYPSNSSSKSSADPIELNAKNNWEGEFKNIKPSKYGYTVKENPEQSPGYEEGVVSRNDKDGFVVTNKTEFITISGSKTWVHDGNEGTIPTDVTVTLKENGTATDKVVTGESWKFENLPKYKNQQEVKYTLEESPVKNYNSTKSEDGYSFTNTFTNKFKVIYEFKPEDSSKTLPEDVTKLLPGEEKDKENGKKVTPSTSEFADVTTDDGTWSFVSWNPTEHIINGADVKFVGTWKFTKKEEPKTGSVYVKYVAEDGKVLEAESKVLENVEVGTEYTTEQKTFDGYEFLAMGEGSAAANGTVVEGKQTVIYVYKVKPVPQPKTGSVYVKYLAEDGTELEAESKVLENVEVGTEYTTEQKTFDGYEFLAMGEGSAAANGTVIEGDLHVTYVYKKTEVTPEPEPKPDPDPNPQPPTTDIITKYVDEDGNNIIPPRDGDRPKEFIPGYEYLRTERSEKLVKHIYTRIHERDDNSWFPVFPSIERDKKIETHPVKTSVPEKVKLNKEDHKAYMFGYPDWTFLPNKNMTRAEVTAMFARLLKNYPSTDVKYNLPYSDVFEKDWYYPAVGFMTENKIVTGYEDGKFRPNDPITRAEFATIASKFEDLVGDKVNGFYDVPESHWALKYINSAYARGWVAGYEDGSFRPDRNITRAEVVTITNKMLIRYADVDFVRANKDLLINFKDLDEGHWAYFNIMEATHGHDFMRKSNGKDELWERLNGEAFIFPELRYKER